MTIIPKPASIQLRAGSFVCTEVPEITGDPVFSREMETVQHQLGSPRGKIRILCTKVDSLPDESYRITIDPEQVQIAAGAGAGMYHGLQTIRQLFLSGQPVPCAYIEDYPRFHWRGFMLDTSRHFYTVPFIKKLIDVLSLHHINRFHWHLTDDQGWRLPVPAYPLLTEIGSKRVKCRPVREHRAGGFYTEEEIRDIVEFAGNRHIEVIPEVDLPGHASAILASYPGLGCTGGPYRVEDRHGIFEDVLCAGNDAIFDLAAAVFDTLAGLFPSRYVHIGGDEVLFNRWDHCPKCQKRLQETGLSSARELQSWITVRLARMLNERGKIPIGWDEVLEDTDRYRLPQDAVIMSWRGTEGGEKALEQGHPVIMTPNTAGCYLDYKHYEDPEEPGHIGVTTIFDSYMLDPAQGIAPEYAESILGAQCNLWSELIYAGRIAEYMIFPRICAAAEAFWTPAGQKDFDNFSSRLPVHQKRLDRLGFIQYRGHLKNPYSDTKNS
ncbi:hypothetical protein FACS1894172_09610 [Spirochaetia bacterium]|nr:hypothetical protein FACS1894172_09610 [Spirochaetia bacterium]